MAKARRGSSLTADQMIASSEARTFDVERGRIIVKQPNGDDYEVELSRCRSPEEILGWMDQIGNKTWCTKDILMRFMNTAVGENRIKIHPA
jgi:hypothetical protein